jgi:hypothetical protein
MVVRFWLSSDGRIENLTATEFDFVQWGFARFIPGTGKENAEIGRFDEPMALLALAQWLNVAGFAETIHHRLSGEIGDHNASGENALEDYLAFCFAGLFSDTSGTRRLEDIFTFAKETPAWAKQTATLVSLYHNPDTGLMEESVVDWASRPSYSLGTRSSSKPKQDSATTPQSKVETEDVKAARVTLKWLEHAERTPICFPSTLMGPDLLFILRLEDGKKIWVAVQSKYESSDLLTASKLKKAIRSLTPSNYFSSTVPVRIHICTTDSAILIVTRRNINRMFSNV